MEDQSQKKQTTWKEKAGVLARPGNVAKTIISAVPYVGNPLLEMQNQVQAYEVDKRLESLSASDAELAAKIRKLEAATPAEPRPINEWSNAAGEFLYRTADLLVVYDAGFHSPKEKGRKLFAPVGHGCLIGKDEVMTCREAWAFAEDIAKHYEGRLQVGLGMAWYDCEAEPIDADSGLLVIRLKNRDEEKWKHANEILDAPDIQLVIKDEVKASLKPIMGEEVGFFHSGQATNVSLTSSPTYVGRQFDASTISHFHRPAKDALKVFVTGVLGGRVLFVGAPVFNRQRALLGIISGIENYKDDAGRRAVVRSLLMHPRFQHLLKGK